MLLKHSSDRDDGAAPAKEKDTAPKFPALAYSIDEYSEVSNLGRSFLYQEIRNGKLEARKAGRRTIILHDEGQRYLNALPELKPSTAKTVQQADSQSP